MHLNTASKTKPAKSPPPAMANPLPPAPIKPRNMRIDAAVTYSGLSRTYLFNALKDGRLIRRKVGKSLLIDVPSLDALIDGLPTN